MTNFNYELLKVSKMYLKKIFFFGVNAYVYISMVLFLGLKIAINFQKLVFRGMIDIFCLEF